MQECKVSGTYSSEVLDGIQHLEGKERQLCHVECNPYCRNRNFEKETSPSVLVGISIL